MSRTLGRLRVWESWTGRRATARALTRGVATVALLAFVAPSPSGGVASDWVLRALLSEDAATVETALQELGSTFYGAFVGLESADSVGAWFREDVDLAVWFGEVLAKGRPEARDAASQFFIAWMSLYPPQWIEFAAENHRSAKEVYEGLYGDDGGDEGDWVPTMRGLRSREDSLGLLAELPESVADDEVRRLALVFAGQMRRFQAALPSLVEEEYDRRQRSGTIGSRPPFGSGEVLEILLQGLAYLQEQWGTEETRKAAWATLMKDRAAKGLPSDVVGVEAPWNLFPMGIAHELEEDAYPLEGRALASGLRRVALALTAEPRTELRHDDRLEAAVSLLANERPLAEEAGRRIFDLYCGSPDGDCFEKLNLLYTGPDDPSLRSIEADVGKRVIESLSGLVKEKERQCGVLAEFEAETSAAVDDSSDPGLPARERIGSIGEELQEVLALVERLDTVPRPVLDGVFEFWSTERFPEARRILEENDWLGPEATAVSSAQRVGPGAGPGPRRRIGVAELCEGRL